MEGSPSMGEEGEDDDDHNMEMNISRDLEELILNSPGMTRNSPEDLPSISHYSLSEESMDLTMQVKPLSEESVDLTRATRNNDTEDDTRMETTANSLICQTFIDLHDFTEVKYGSKKKQKTVLPQSCRKVKKPVDISLLRAEAHFLEPGQQLKNLHDLERHAKRWRMLQGKDWKQGRNNKKHVYHHSVKKVLQSKVHHLCEQSKNLLEFKTTTTSTRTPPRIHLTNADSVSSTRPPELYQIDVGVQESVLLSKDMSARRINAHLSSKTPTAFIPYKDIQFEDSNRFQLHWSTDELKTGSEIELRFLGSFKDPGRIPSPPPHSLNNDS